MAEYHVSKKGGYGNSGTYESPFLTIQQAADRAVAGDRVVVHEGVYRERVAPKNTGISEFRPITYEAATGEKVVIKGSEAVASWELVEGTVWKAVIDNRLFNGYNPFALQIRGDWMISGQEKTAHLGDVYLNGKSLYEAQSMEEVYHPPYRTVNINIFMNVEMPEICGDAQNYVWFAEVGQETTILYANFQKADPNSELVEINCRQTCFYPERTGIDYIIVRGFEMCQAATPWAPPTADQPGLMGPRWSKGWIIEDNIIHDAKCSGISLGKVAESGNMFCTDRYDKPGYTYQLESVFTALEQGWSKERVGSHIVRRNHIYDCGQNGIVGHMGCAFSKVYDNHIHHIALKREFFGWEIAGIKFHAAIDVLIQNNHIHHCNLGAWLDWQAQGTRVSRNVFHDNEADFFVEVSHGPFLIENNIFASRYALKSFSQGGAYVNNLIAGSILIEEVRERATPYHLKHSTKVKGYGVIYGGDTRYYNNIFIGWEGVPCCGTALYDGHPASLEEYSNEVRKEIGDVERFSKIKEPVYINDNVYLQYASVFHKEEHALEDAAFHPNLQVTWEEGRIDLKIDLPDGFDQHKVSMQTTDTLGRTRISDAEFEEMDGSVLSIGTDINGNPFMGVAGPIQSLTGGSNQVVINRF